MGAMRAMRVVIVLARFLMVVPETGRRLRVADRPAPAVPR